MAFLISPQFPHIPILPSSRFLSCSFCGASYLQSIATTLGITTDNSKYVINFRLDHVSRKFSARVFEENNIADIIAKVTFALELGWTERERERERERGGGDNE